MVDEEYNQQRGGGIVLSPDNAEAGEEYRQEEKSANTTPSLNILNFLNLLFYVANILVTYLVGNAGLNGLPTNADQSLKYQVCPIVSFLSSDHSCPYVMTLYTFFYLQLSRVRRLLLHRLVGRFRFGQ